MCTVVDTTVEYNTLHLYGFLNRTGINWGNTVLYRTVSYRIDCTVLYRTIIYYTMIFFNGAHLKLLEFKFRLFRHVANRVK